MATVAEIKKILEGLPDDALFGIQSHEGSVVIPHHNREPQVFTVTVGPESWKMAVVLSQRPSDDEIALSEERMDAVDENS